MPIKVREKRYGNGRTSVKTNKKLPISFDLPSLDLMCEYVISENRNIKRGQYINLRNLIDMLDMEKYINDPEKNRRIIFIRRGIEARLVKGLDNPTTIISYINGGILDSNIIDLNNFKSLSNAEIEWINETVTNALSSSFIYEDADLFIDLFTRFKTADYTSISSLTDQIREAVVNLNNKFRRSKIESAQDAVFSLRDDIFNQAIIDIHKEITSEYRYLKTGMQGFNQLIGGGFESSRLYLLLGVTGAGKSLSMLNLAYQIKKYNKNFKPKDPTKTPCVVYLTMENTVTETVQRLFQICTGEDMRNHTPDEIENMLRIQGELYITDDSPIDLIIKYKPNRSVDTSYLYTLTEDLEDEGYEVICFIQDHVKRIRSIEHQPDTRLELGNVVNEMKNFAIIKDIPVITDSHLNRDGARIIDENANKSKGDLTRLLGKANIGESLLMLDNCDLGIILNRECDYEGVEHMVFKVVKKRIMTMRDYVCIPFSVNNSIKLVEDFYSKVPVFKDTMMQQAPTNGVMNNNASKNLIKQSSYSNVKHIDDDENIYTFASRYSSIIQPSPSKQEVQKFIYVPNYHTTQYNEEGMFMPVCIHKK